MLSDSEMAAGSDMVIFIIMEYFEHDLGSFMKKKIHTLSDH